MEKAERMWFGFLIVVALSFNIVTLSPLVPWQKWLLWTPPTPDQTVRIAIRDYTFDLPPEGIRIKAGEYVEFVATSADVTYGFGVFRQDGRLVFQMQVIPGHENKIVWRFDQPGVFDVRSTEYSGPRHSEMSVGDAIHVVAP